MERNFTYYAFISYSHFDERWAIWIQKSLENYKLPSIAQNEAGNLPKNIRPVFRDATDLPTGHLGKNLARELEESRYLIVVCSPNSAKPNIQGKHWVNDEVSRFIEMGKEDYIIPVIVQGKPNSANLEEECLPPAIKERDILGIDATVMPRARVLSDLAAKILGLRPDILWNRRNRQVRKQRRINFGILFFVLLTLFAGAFIYWDWTCEKVECYADYVDQWGLPIGIFPLDKKMVSKKSSHYRFISQKSRLRKIIHSNAAGIPVNHDQAWILDRPAIQTINYKGEGISKGKVDSIDFMDRKGKILQRWKFSGKDISCVDIIVIDEKEIESATMLSARTTSLSSGMLDIQKSNSAKSDISRLKYKRDDNGYISKLQFFRDNRDVPTKDVTGRVRMGHSGAGQNGPLF